MEVGGESNGESDAGSLVIPVDSGCTNEYLPDSTTEIARESNEQTEEQVSSSTVNNTTNIDNAISFLNQEDNGVRYHQDGSDSGVEVNGSGGVGFVETEMTPAVSCDSSLISCCYSSEDLVSTTLQLSEDFRDLSLNTGDGTSEGGSESSSTTGYHKPSRTICSVLRKKSSSSSSSNNKSQVSSSTSNRPNLVVSSSTSSRSRTPMSRDRSLSSRHGISNKTAQNTPTTSKGLHPSSAKMPSTSRARAPSCDNNTKTKNVSLLSTSNSSSKSTHKSRTLTLNTTDDGRWPSSYSRANQVNLPKNRPSPLTNEKKLFPHVMTSSFSHVEASASSALDKYATLPRRHRRSAENLSVCHNNTTIASSLLSTSRESRTMSREPSLNRTASLRQKHNTANNTTTTSNNMQNIKSIPPYPHKNRTTKTRIYHEISIQTSLTGQDVDNALAGKPPTDDIHSRVEVSNRSIQVDRRMEEVERLEAKLKEMQQEITRLQVTEREFDVMKDIFKREKESSTALQLRLLNLVQSKDVSTPSDVITTLEEEVRSSNELIIKQQAEITTLHALCTTLNEDLDKSYAAQKMLLQQQQEGEVEALEMQDFLQAEKSTLAESLHDTESELNHQTTLVKQKDNDLQRLQEECSHLVRVSEQRRQEAMSMASKLKTVESRSKEALLQQGASVSSAAVALSGLGTRLETLVDSLVMSYAISEHDLEDVVFHNEVYSDSSSSEGSPQHGTCSSKVSIQQATINAATNSGSSGFVAAVMNAIRSATASHSHRSQTDNSSESEQMLCSEPEPQAFTNRDVTCESSPEKRLSVASVDDYESLRTATTTTFNNSESLQNLTEAILKRQQIENSEVNESSSASPVIILPAASLVDQVIEIDNLVTRLLKVLRIIHAANEQTTKIKSIQFTEQLNQKEDQRQNSEEIIERLRQEVHQLQTQIQACDITDNQTIGLKDRLNDKELTLNELGRKLCLTKELLTDNWNQAMIEVRRQYEAIDNALEMMQSVQSIVQQNPILTKVQQTLEETNFHSASTLPVISTSDLNANATTTSTATLINTLNNSSSPTINGTA